jgi:hypothetical protein
MTVAHSPFICCSWFHMLFVVSYVVRGGHFSFLDVLSLSLSLSRARSLSLMGTLDLRGELALISGRFFKTPKRYLEAPENTQMGTCDLSAGSSHLHTHTHTHTHLGTCDLSGADIFEVLAYLSRSLARSRALSLSHMGTCDLSGAG